MEEINTTQKNLLKKTTAIFIAMLFLLSVAPLVIVANGAPDDDVVSVCDKADLPTVDTTVIDEYVAPSTFVMAIYIENATDLFLAEAGLEWNASVLQLLSFSYGTFFSDQAISTINVDGDTSWGDGKIDTPYAMSSTSVGGTGDGILFEAEFKCLLDSTTGAETWINLTAQTNMEDSLGSPLAWTGNNGYYFVTKYIPPARAATIDMTQNPISGDGLGAGSYWLGENVTVTAITTVQAFNDVSETYCAATIFNWTIEYPNGTIVKYELDGTSKVIVFDQTGDFIISVVGYAACMMPDYPGLAWSNTVTHTKTVWGVSLGGAIDVYTETRRFCGVTTDKIGAGPGQPADAYTGDEHVTLYANVTYNGDGMQNRLVSWEVWRPDGSGGLMFYFTSTSMTNSTGVATMSFRIPIFCENATGHHGKWWVLAKVTVPQCQEEPHEEITVNDTIQFDVGYLIEVSILEAINQPYVKCEVAYFNVQVKVISQTTRIIWGYATLRDDCNVVVATFTLMTPIPGAEFCNPLYYPPQQFPLILGFHVPKCSLTGNGELSITLYTLPPSECGKAYAPEYTIPVAITH
jgi:hypothetical protein